MVFQRKMWTGKFQHWSTTTGRFITDSIIPLQITLVAHLWIYLPIPFMIDPARIKDTNISQICSNLTSLLPRKIILVIWTPIMIFHISFLLMILILSIYWRKICLSKAGSTEDTAVGKIVQKDATKGKGSIAPHALIIARNFIFVMGFSGLVQRQWFVSWNINIICHNFSVDNCVYLPSIL